MLRAKAKEILLYIEALAESAARSLGISGYAPEPAKTNSENLAVLFVCTGNICRSAYADRKFRDLLEQHNITSISVASAGVDTTPGKEADPTAQSVAYQRGVDLTHHRTTKLTPEMATRADVIVLFDRSHVNAMRANYSKVLPKSLLLGSLGYKFGQPISIADPFGRPAEVFRSCFSRIDESLEILLDHLRNSQPESAN